MRLTVDPDFDPDEYRKETEVLDPVHAWLARMGVFVLGIVLLRMAFELWWIGRIHEHVWGQIGLSFMYLGAAIFLFLAIMDIEHRKLHYLGFLALCGGLFFTVIVTIGISAIHYRSDAMLFIHQASALALTGVNPYGVDLIGGYEAFEVPYYVQTPTTSGGLVTNLNYPALSFLMYAPFVAVGMPDLRPISAAYLLAVVGLIFASTPRHLRLLITSLLFLSPFFLSFAIAGFDIAYILLLLITVVLWNENKVGAMVAFGMSMAVKQQVWFIAPFILIRLWREREGGDETYRQRWWHLFKHMTYAAAAFFVPNMIFIILDPQAWLTGVLTPVGGSGETLVPLAQGIFTWVYTGTVYVDSVLIGLLALGVFGFLLGTYYIYFDRMKEALWLAPMLILLFNARSLQNYYEMFYPIGLAALVAMLPRELLELEPETVITELHEDEVDSGGNRMHRIERFIENKEGLPTPYGPGEGSGDGSYVPDSSDSKVGGES